MQQNKLLNVEELIREVNSVSEIEPKILSHGLKPKFPENTVREAESIKSYQDDLKKLISTERVARNNDRSQAVLCSDGQIIVERKTGKWNLFGKLNYLEPHEALYLMEMNKLEVYHDSVIVSLEKAYCMFLKESSEAAPSTKISKEEYIIYSQFMRFGCNILRHTPETDDDEERSEQMVSSPTGQQREPNQESNLYAWHYLYELLDLKKQLPIENSFNELRYAQVKTSMNNIMSNIKDLPESGTSSTDQDDDINQSSSGTKRKTNAELSNIIPEKRISLESGAELIQRYGNYALNAFMVGPEFKLFQNIFSKIDVIKLNLTDDDNINCDQLEFSFDLFLLDASFSRSRCEQPTYRITILRNHTKKIPTSKQIIRLYKRQKFKSTIILICVNEDLSFHAYIYRFTVE